MAVVSVGAGGTEMALYVKGTMYIATLYAAVA